MEDENKLDGLEKIQNVISNSSLDDIFKASKIIIPKIESFIQYQNDVFAKILNAWKLLTVSYDFSKIFESLQNALENLKKLPISEERKKELEENYKKWGEYGWTYFPNSDIFFFENAPGDLESANVEMMSYCSKQEIDELFSCLRKSSVKKDDLETAIFCFENHKYKPCALVLFSLIDGKLIKNQGSKAVNRKVGGVAVSRFKQKLETDEEKAFYEILYNENVFACLESFFQGYTNFKDEPKIINRNFLMHGMTGRAVRKRDCIQLFLLLNNMLLLMDT